MKNPLRFLFALDRLLYKIEDVLLIIITLLIMILAFLPIVLRAVFDNSIIWAPELNRLLVLWLCFVGASLCVQENKHLSLEAIAHIFPKICAPYIKIVVFCFTIFICGVMTYLSYHYFALELSNINLGDYLFAGLPKTYFKLIYPLGFGLITFHYCVKLIECVIALCRPQQNSLAA